MSAKSRDIPVESAARAGKLPPIMVVVCPKCDVALILLEFGPVEVDYCSQCEGLWLDAGEIEHLLENTSGEAHDLIKDFVLTGGSTETGRQAYLCPRCDRKMCEISRPDIDGQELLIERCPRGDGLWFDKGELLRLLQAAPPEVRADGAIEVLKDVLGYYITKPSEGDA